MTDAQDSAPERIGRPFPKGKSGNPGGQPKWVKRVKKALGQHAERAAEVLRQVMDHGEPADQVRAAKVVLEYTMPKPTEKVQLDLNPAAASKLSGAMAAKLAEMDS